MLILFKIQIMVILVTPVWSQVGMRVFLKMDDDLFSYTKTTSIRRRRREKDMRKIGVWWTLIRFPICRY